MAHENRFPAGLGSLGGVRSFPAQTQTTLQQERPQVQAPNIFAAPELRSSAFVPGGVLTQTDQEQFPRIQARGEPSIGGSTPATDFQTFQTPSGGEVGIPRVLPDGRTAEDIQAGVVGQQAGALPGSQSEQERAALLVREAKQQQIIRESGSTSAARKTEESLREQGISQENIDKAVGETSSNFERLQKLNQLQKREALKRSSTKKVQGARDRLAQNARRDEDGGAKNKAAIAEDIDNFFQGFGADTDSTTPLFDQLNNSQKREVEKFLSDASRGASTDRQQRRMEQFKAEAERKDEKAFRGKQNKATQAKIKKAIADATSKEEKQFFDIKGKQLTAITKRLEGKFTGDEKRAGLKDSLVAQQAQLQQDIATGFVPEVPVATGAAGATAPSTASGEVERQTSDGQVAIFDAETKEFIRFK